VKLLRKISGKNFGGFDLSPKQGLYPSSSKISFLWNFGKEIEGNQSFFDRGLALEIVFLTSVFIFSVVHEC